MWKSKFASEHFALKIIILLGLLLLCGIVSLSAYSIVVSVFFDGVQNLALMQIIQSFGVFILPAVLTAYLCTGSTKAGLQWQIKQSWQLYLWVTLLMLSAIPAINLLAWLNEQVTFPHFMSGIEQWFRTAENNAKSITESMLRTDNISGLAFNILLIAILPALSEEIFFRGALQKILKSWRGAVTAIWITAFIFSAIHMQFYGFVPRMLLGAMFGYLVYWSGGLGLAIWAHFVNNAIAVSFHYLQQNHHTQFPLDSIGSGKSIWLGLFSILAVGFLLMKIRKNSSEF